MIQKQKMLKVKKMKNVKNVNHFVKNSAHSNNKKNISQNFKKLHFWQIFANFFLKNDVFCVFSVIFSVFLTFFLISCSSAKIGIEKNKEKLSPVYITNAKKINLLKNNEFSENRENVEKIDVMQLISGNFSNQNFEFLANLIINDEEISFSLLSPMGTDLGNFSYRDNFVNFYSDFFPKKMKAEYIIADIQNAYFPFENLKQNFEKAGLTFTQEIQVISDKNDSQNSKNKVIIRRIYDKNQLIETISVFNDIITIENNLRNYKYVLQTLEEVF